MQDWTGRTIDYLRLSVTDLCNYRCRYCMEEAGVPKLAHSDILSIEELAEIGRAAVRCGVTKIRLTGGEPLVRRGIVELCRQLRQEPRLRELDITTNGSLLPELAGPLRRAGVDRLNISLDTLRADRFAEITRRGSLPQVLEGLAAAEAAGFPAVKLNTVLLGGWNTDEIPALVALTRDRPCCVRFIELMPMGVCAGWPDERFVAADLVLRAVPELEPVGKSGVAELYRVPGYRGTVGLIRPMSHRFCGDCNRIRVTADGKLKPCLHSPEEIPLRGLHGEALEAAIRAAAAGKPERHRLTELHCSSAVRSMNEIGG